MSEITALAIGLSTYIFVISWEGLVFCVFGRTWRREREQGRMMRLRRGFESGFRVIQCYNLTTI